MDMDLIRPNTLADLAAIEQENCVSILMPSHPTGKDSRQDPIRLENLLNKAQEALKERGMRRPDIDSLLEPARDVLGQLSFWQHQGYGLAIYLAPGTARMLRLPEAVQESMTIGPRFNVKPILASVAASDPFYVLALTEERAKLFLGSQKELVEINASGFPITAEEVVAVRDPEVQLQSHGGAAPPGARGDRGTPSDAGQAHYHGHGEGESKLEADTVHYIKAVAERVASYLYQDDSPLILAADNGLAGLYRREHRRGRLLETGVAGSPDSLSLQDLRQRAWGIAAPVLEGDQSQMLDRFGTAAAAGKGAEGFAEVAEAAAVGKIDVLLFDPRAQQAGQLSEDGTSASLVDADEEAADGAACEDLVNRAVVDTLRSSGRVIPLRYGTERAPQHPKAILRY
ncbi:baeRF3 domain-containing protein [Candidatus Laterigemmans baculatus]|uniref:baeRF3 domain-containing protein n=1 Tax=Candidatus Laterigemmans baculatus TaxID=2770505 RepID=UPI0013DCFE17|nr:hypothetical protein [Candidatus Laterigemmans baculatus]